MGGVGKTTLAKHINNRLLQQSEERVIWVTVSQAFTIKKLQDEIARAMHVDLSDEENEDKRAARLGRALSRRKNILILDDVWENINLEKVGYPLSEEGFRLIITTRSVEVCRRIGCKEMVVVKTLPKGEAWELFSEKLGNETRLTPQVEKIAKHIAEMCGGLPLGIIVLAGSMRGETTIHFWRDALTELKEYSIMGRDDMEDEVFKVLKYSFDRLNPNFRRKRHTSHVYNPLQLCFLYCSLYPEDHATWKQQLIGKFISEELMDKRKCRRALVDQGNCILDKLVNVCLLESCALGWVKMHDLVRSMALKITEGTTLVIAGDKSLVEIPNEEEWTMDLEKVSLMENGISEIPPGMCPNCPKLSTLLFSDNPLLFLPDSFFSKMQGLCTLDLSHTQIIELPDSLSALERLKVLLLRCCRGLVYVPYLGNLKVLTELDLSETAIKELPQGIEELVHLKYLAINVKTLEMVPSELLLRFLNLQCLEFPDHIEAPMAEIEKLKNVEEFFGRVKNMCDFNRFVRSRVYETLFSIEAGSSSKIYEKNQANGVYLHSYNFEEKDEAILGDNIERLSIWNSEGLSSSLLDNFQRLLRIKYLQIEECGGIECILKGEQFMEELRELQSQSFSILEEVSLLKLWDLKGIIIMEKRDILASAPSRQALFSCLRELSISNCHKMKKLGLPVSEFPILEKLFVRECSEIEEIFMEVGTGVGEARFVSLPKLKWLHMYSLPRLESICNKATINCPSIEQIEFSKCPSLKKFPLNVVPPPPSLRQIFFMYKEEWASMEWEHPTHPLLLQPFLIFWN